MRALSVTLSAHSYPRDSYDGLAQINLVYWFCTDKYPDATEKLKLMKDASDLENFASEENFKKSRARRHRMLPLTSPETSEGNEKSGSESEEDIAGNKKKAKNGFGKKSEHFPRKPSNFVTVTDNITSNVKQQDVSKNSPSSTSAKPRTGEDL